MDIKPTYTVISVERVDKSKSQENMGEKDVPTMMRFDVFNDEEKMRKFLMEYAKENKRCIIVPGLVQDVDYQVEFEEDQKTIKTIHFEYEDGYKPFGILSLTKENITSIKLN